MVTQDGYVAELAKRRQTADVDHSSTTTTPDDEVEFQRKIREQVEKDITPLKSDHKHTYNIVWLDQGRPLGSMYR